MFWLDTKLAKNQVAFTAGHRQYIKTNSIALYGAGGVQHHDEYIDRVAIFLHMLLHDV